MPRYRDVELTLFNRKPNSNEDYQVKQVCTIVFDEFHDGTPVRSEEEQVEAFLEKIYNWKKGLQYSHLSIKTLKEHNKMAKKATTAATEEQTTELSVFETKAKGITLPEIPKVMNIGGVDMSEEAIKKAVDAVKKIVVDVPKQTDTVAEAEEKKKVYLSLVEKKNQFVKTRTGADKFRKDITDPLNNWSKKLKAQTDAFGTLSREGQEHCEAQIYIWENWEAEQERIKQEATKKLVDTRSAELLKVAGVLNPASLHWTFDHIPSKIVENLFLENADDSEWNGLMKELEDSFEADKQAKIAREAEFEAAKSGIYKTRLQMIQMLGGYEQVEGGYTKNGHTLTEDQIKNTSEDAWLPLIQSHQVAPTNPFAAPIAQPVAQQESPVSTAPSEPTLNPFAQFAAPQENPASAFGAPTQGGEAIPVYDTIDEVQSEPVPCTLWPTDFVEQVLGKTKIRMFPIEHQGVAMEGVHDVKYEGKFANGLMFVIFA